MKESVYIETTVISYLTAWPSRDLIRAAHQQITNQWWLTRRDHFELFVSELVVKEASAGDEIASASRLSVIADISLLTIGEDAEDLARKLIAKKALPQKALLDALHIAIATTNDVDYLLTWNCRHMANAEMQDVIEEVCEQSGFTAPRICTPEELMGGEE